MFPDPKVTVVIPTYNRPESLRLAIKSVLEQSYQNLEIIIIDDSPTDESEIVAKEFRSESVRYFRRHGRLGVSSARNLGVRISSGDFIAFLDDDDEWFPSKLEQQINLFEKIESRYGVVHSNCFFDNGKEVYLYHKAATGKESLDKLLESDYIANSTSLIKKECFKKVGYFDENLPYAEDWDMYIRIAKQFMIKYIHEPLAIRHVANVGLGRDIRISTRGYQLFFAKHWQEYKKHRRVLSHYLYEIGRDLNIMGEKRGGRIFLVNAFKIFPLDPKPVLLILTEVCRTFLSLLDSHGAKMTVLRRYSAR